MISVKEAPFNAKGDGTTDDRTVIQAAIVAAGAAGGGTVYFPNGTYIVSDTGGAFCLDMVSKVTLEGESRVGAIIKMKNCQPGSTRPIRVKDVTDVYIRNLTIDGNKANQTVEEHRAGIFLWNSARVVLSDLTI